LDEFDQVAVVIGQTHLCGPPYTPPCGVVRAHKAAENAGGVGRKWLEGREKKKLEILAAGFRFLLGRAHKRGCVGLRGFEAGWGGLGVRNRGARRHTDIRRAGSPWQCVGSSARLCRPPRGHAIINAVPPALCFHGSLTDAPALSTT
jgi:hypothetical protein